MRLGQNTKSFITIAAEDQYHMTIVVSRNVGNNVQLFVHFSLNKHNQRIHALSRTHLTGSIIILPPLPLFAGAGQMSHSETVQVQFLRQTNQCEESLL